MGTSGFDRELALFDATAKLESALAPPFTWYTDENFFAAERHRIFQKSWLCVGHIDQVNKPGKFFSGRIIDDPFVVINGEDGVLRAFHNVCSHKGCELAPPKGKCDEFVCPYHGWTYKHNGELCKTPHIGKQSKGFDLSQLGLRPISCKQWGPFIFIDLDGSWSEKDKDCRSLEEDMEPLKKVLDEMGWENMKYVEGRTYDIDCNWKVFVDNAVYA